MVAAGCNGGGSPGIGSELGGEASVVDAGANAFSHPIPSLTAEDRRAFFVGNSFFNDNWVAAPASTEGRDGLGPLFNAQSCSSCHFRDGRGTPPDDDPSSLGLLLRLSAPGADGPVDEPTLGDQLQDRAVGGVEPEGRIEITHIPYMVDERAGELALPQYRIQELASYAASIDQEVMMSPRLAPQIAGVGLLEAIPASTIRAAEDPGDADGDGISGRANRVVDAATGETVLGRFGWKASVPSVRQQNAAAFRGDIGITSTIFVEEPCTSAQDDCLAAPSGGSPELNDEKLDRVTFYARTLAVPTRRNADDPTVRTGEAIFTELGCTACHTPTLRTGDSDIEQLAHQDIHPFTDLLLHDLGPGLADGRPDGLATGTEWRTPPLWGIGLIEVVNDDPRYLHDGRARTFSEAIRWHDGEAAPARRAYTELSDEQREALHAFLGDL